MIFFCKTSLIFFKAYEDDFENDFESDTSDKEIVKKNGSAKQRDTSAKKSSSSTSNRPKSYTSDSGTDDYHSKPAKSSSKSKKYDDYDDDDNYYSKKKSADSSRVVKANALVKIPTDSVEVFSSKIYFNHDSVDRQKRRAKDLMKTIELDRKNINLLDLNPIEMRTVYSSHLKHVNYLILLIN